MAEDQPKELPDENEGEKSNDFKDLSSKMDMMKTMITATADTLGLHMAGLMNITEKEDSGGKNITAAITTKELEGTKAGKELIVHMMKQFVDERLK